MARVLLAGAAVVVFLAVAGPALSGLLAPPAADGDGGDDSASGFAPRLLFLAGALLFLLVANAPALPHSVQGRLVEPRYGVWAVACVAVVGAVPLMLEAREPALAAVPLIMAAYAVGAVAQRSPPGLMADAVGAAPWAGACAALLAGIALVFFSDAPRVDRWMDEAFARFRFAPSALPRGYLSGPDTFLAAGGAPLAALLAAASFAYLYFSAAFARAHSTPGADVARLLDPGARGPENVARFLEARAG